MAEVRRLVATLSGPPGAWAERLRWSRWRRLHQAAAARGHAARRARRAPPPPVEVAAPVVAVAGTPTLTDAGWGRVEPLLTTVPGKRGRPPTDHCRVLGGVLGMMRTGVAWRAAPEEEGSWQTLYSRYTSWLSDGTWDRILAVLLADDAPVPPPC